MSDNKNTVLAVVLSGLVLIGWQFFVIGPRMEEERLLQEAIQAEEALRAEQQAGSVDQPLGSSEPSSVPRVATDSIPAPVTAAPNLPGTAPISLGREQALEQSRRVTIDTPKLRGSISLTGARFDDLELKGYREELDENSPEIQLLNPSRSENPYFIEFGWVSDNPNVAVPNDKTVWSQVSSNALSVGNPVTLTWENGGGQKFERVVSVDEDYMFTVSQTVTNNGSSEIALYPYALIKRMGMPETEGFFILHEGMVGVFNSTLQEISYGDLIDDGTYQESTTGGWLGITDKYWLTALVPNQRQNFRGQFRALPNGITSQSFQADYIQDGIRVAPGSSTNATNRFFAGAKKVSIIESYEGNPATAVDGNSYVELFRKAIDWGYLFFLTEPFFWGLDYFGNLTGNFGVAILLLTLLIKVALYWFANKSYVAMSKMKKLQPEMMKIRERYEDDKVKQQQELMDLYKREKVNPLAGCWPMLIQIPVFFALYKVLFVTIEMRHAPFFGWIQDLSAPDPTSIFNLFGLLPFEPWTFLMIGIWPIFMGITMFLQQKMNPAPADPVQEKVFMFMPLFFTFLLAQFPAGLVIYWAWNNLLSIAQQYVIMRRMGVEVNFVENMKLDKLFKSSAKTENEKTD